MNAEYQVMLFFVPCFLRSSFFLFYHCIVKAVSCSCSFVCAVPGAAICQLSWGKCTVNVSSANCKQHQVPKSKQKNLSIHIFIPGTRCCYIPTLWGGLHYKQLNNCKKLNATLIITYVLHRWLSGTSTYAIFSYLYIACFELVPAWKQDLIPGWNTSSGLKVPCEIRAHITTNLHKLKTALDAGRGGWRAK